MRWVIWPFGHSFRFFLALGREIMARYGHLPIYKKAFDLLSLS